MSDCEVRANCDSRHECWYCVDYARYKPIDPKVLCQRQVRERRARRMQKKARKQTEASKLGRRSKRKGYEGEREIVTLLRRYGIEAERVPLSGSLKSEKYSCDVVLENGKRIEVKRRKSGLKTLRRWLNEDSNSNYVFFREDGDQNGWLVVMPYMEFIELVRGDEAC